MARPERNNVDYFPFICEDGKKMYYIEETYGNDGFASFVKILRELAKTDNHFLDLSNNTTLMFLSAKCKVNKETLTLIINDLVELGKFDKVLWIENKIIWCQDFIDSIQDAYIKRKNKCITYEGLLLLLQSKGIRKQNKSKPKGGIKPQSKEDKRIEDESILKNIPDFSEFLLYAKENEPTVNEGDLKLKYLSWVENGWKDGKNSPIEKWKVKLLNTMPYIKKDFNTNGNKPKMVY